MRFVLISLLYLFTVAGLAFGIYAFWYSERDQGTVLHQIEGLIGVLIGTVGLGLGAVFHAIEATRKETK